MKEFRHVKVSQSNSGKNKPHAYFSDAGPPG
jgi:hypothetical protein